MRCDYLVTQSNVARKSLTNYMISEQRVVCASASKWTSRGGCVEETDLVDLAVISGE